MHLSGCTDTLEDAIQPLETKNALLLKTKAVDGTSASERVAEELVMSEDMKKMEEQVHSVSSSIKKFFGSYEGITLQSR